ncbi:MAG TPA: GNAT family N-acetyltransferase [Pyrinomonadaceae bacterium]
MPQLTKLKENAATATHLSSMADSLRTHVLTNDQQAEVLDFLAVRPLHTVVMSGLIRDNGLESPFNRGTFYACRNRRGELEGVALIGHAMFIEVRSYAALKALARQAQNVHHTHMIMGEQERIEHFWSYYSEAGQSLRIYCREVLFEQTWPVEALEPVPGLRPATLDDLLLVMPVHAALAYEESGINPLDTDPQGFRLRCERRIEQGRVWVWVERNELIFKADIISETPEVIYLEGVYVDRKERSKGYGLRCMSQMSRQLLGRTKAISLLVNEEHRGAQLFFQKVGFKPRGFYDTIFLRQESDAHIS